MKRLFFILFLTQLVSSCGPEEAQFTMPEDELIKLLYDIQVAEAAIQTVHSTSKDSVIAIYYDQIFELHDIDQEILKQNIATLKGSPEKAHNIYKQVLEFHKEHTKKKK